MRNTAECPKLGMLVPRSPSERESVCECVCQPVSCHSRVDREV